MGTAAHVGALTRSFAAVTQVHGVRGAADAAPPIAERKAPALAGALGVEPAGLEPATSWVRYRLSGVTSSTFGSVGPRSLRSSDARFAQFGSTDGRSSRRPTFCSCARGVRPRGLAPVAANAACNLAGADSNDSYRGDFHPFTRVNVARSVSEYPSPVYVRKNPQGCRLAGAHHTTLRNEKANRRARTPQNRPPRPGDLWRTVVFPATD